MYMRMETSTRSLNDTYVVSCVSGPVRLVLGILEGFGIQACEQHGDWTRDDPLASMQGGRAGTLTF